MPSFRTHRRAGVHFRVLVAVLVAALSLIGYCTMRQVNPITGEEQRVALSVDQEIALGLQAAPEIASRHGGLEPDAQTQARVDRIGQRLLEAAELHESPWHFEFHVLDDDQTINAMALPGGQIFITDALVDRMQTDGQIAGVLAHEIGHVVERHAAEQLAKANLTQGLAGAVAIGAYDPERPSTAAAGAVAAAVAALANLSYGRDDELESDRWGVRLLAEAGYDPRSMLAVMEVLAQAGGRRGMPEFFSTHPNPENRLERIRREITELFPGGVPAGLDP